MKSISFCNFVGIACGLHAKRRYHSCNVWEEWAVPSQRIAFLSWSLALLENVSFGPQVFDFKTRLGLKHLARRARKIFMKCTVRPEFFSWDLSLQKVKVRCSWDYPAGHSATNTFMQHFDFHPFPFAIMWLACKVAISGARASADVTRSQVYISCNATLICRLRIISLRMLIVGHVLFWNQ